MNCAIALPMRGRSIGFGRVTARRSRTLPLGALLALLAVVGMTALSTWHGASVHDDRAHAAAGATAHGDATPDDMDGAVHVGAHPVGQGIDLPAVQAAPAVAATDGPAWLLRRAALPEALAPPTLLRPPRA